MLHETLGSSVVVTVDFVPFDKSIFLDEFLEFFLCLEEVMDSVDFAFARGAGGGRDGILDVGKILDDQILEGGLACAACGTHHE